MKSSQERIQEIADEVRDAIWEFLQDAIKDESVYGNAVNENVGVCIQGQNVILTVPNIGKVRIAVTPFSQQVGK